MEGRDAVTLDDSQLKTFSQDLGLVPKNLVSQIRPIVRKGAMNIKKTMQNDLRKSSSFRQVAQSVDFDEFESGAFGSTAISAEIGPNKSRHQAAGLAGFAYFGGSPAGGGTVRDPAEALAEEAPTFERYLEQVVEGLI